MCGAGEATALTATGAILGSPEYMSPEQVAGDTTVDAQTDVWAMGVVLYEALTGHVPFRADSPTGTMDQVLHAPITPIASWDAGVAPDLAAAVHRALERDRLVRYATMQRFVEALLETRAWRAEAAPVEFDTTERDLAPPTEPEVDPDAPTLVRDEPAPPLRRLRSPRASAPGWLIVLGAALVVVIAALVGRAIGRAGS